VPVARARNNVSDNFFNFQAFEIKHAGGKSFWRAVNRGNSVVVVFA
jgi:hypothetical protein